MDREVWNSRYAERELIWSAEPNRFLVSETDSLPPGRALDLACGEGRNAVWLAQQGWTVTGVDFAEVGLEKARRLADSRGVEVSWIAADLLAYEPPEAAFDLVAMLYLQLPSAQRRTVLHSAAAAVAPGGTLLVIAHDSDNIAHGHGGPKDPTVLYTSQDVVSDLEPTGLRIDRAERVERSVQTDDGVRIALDALVRAAAA